MDGALFLREIGVVASSARSYEAPVLIFKGAEQFVREEALVVIDDAKFSKRFLGVLRYVTKLDPLLNPSQRSAVIEKPEIADEGLDIPYETSLVRIIGEIIDGRIDPPSSPPNPRSRVSVVESPGELDLKLGEGLAIGLHKHSGLQIPFRAEALRYHIAVVGTTGTGKSRLVKAIIDEVLEKTGWSVIVFDHTGMDYVPYWKSKVVRADEVVLDVETISDGLTATIGSAERLFEEYVPLALIRYILCGGSAPCKDYQDLNDLKKMEINISREILEKKTLELSRKKGWKASELAKTTANVADDLGARQSTCMKLALYIALFAETYVKRLNSMSLTINELVERARRDRILVVDLSTVETEARRAIVKGFLERLWDMVSEKLEPANTLIVIDEAHNYACMQGCSPSSALIEKTLREGRKWGLGVLLASQRVIDLSPDVRNNVNTVFFSRLQTPYDYEQLRNFVDLAGIRPESLSLLETREFFFAGLGNPLNYPMLIRVREVGEPSR
jgi:DNA helicase HerA-like ATPase